MKLTWFGGTTMRLHIGGTMLVIDAEGAPATIDRAELLSGADQLRLADTTLERVDSATWAPRGGRALVDTPDLPNLQIYRIGEAGVVIDAIGERPLLLITGATERLGRWVRNAVVVIAGEPAVLPELAVDVLDRLGPSFIAVAGPETAIEQVIARVRDGLNGTGLLALEPGLALEI